MRTTRILMLAGLTVLSSCGGERGREVAVADSLSLELEIAPEDTTASLSDERRTQAGRRAPATRFSATEQARKRAAPGPVRTGMPRADTAAADSASPEPLEPMVDPIRTDTGRAAEPVPNGSPADSTLSGSPSADSSASDAAPAATPPPATPPAATSPASPASPAAVTPPASAADSGPPGAGQDALAAGTQVRALLQDSIHSRRHSAGQIVTALVSGDLRTPDGRTLVPSGSAVRLSIARLKPARTRSAADGELELRADSIVVNGRAYPVRAEVQPVPHELRGRGVTAGEAEKVAAGAAVGAVAGGVITGKTKGAVIGGVVGAAGGAVVAAQTASRDVVVAPQTLLVLTLTAPFAASEKR